MLCTWVWLACVTHQSVCYVSQLLIPSALSCLVPTADPGHSGGCAVPPWAPDGSGSRATRDTASLHHTSICDSAGKLHSWCQSVHGSSTHCILGVGGHATTYLCLVWMDTLGVCVICAFVASACAFNLLVHFTCTELHRGCSKQRKTNYANSSVWLTWHYSICWMSVCRLLCCLKSNGGY